MPRPISVIAHEIARDWKKVYFGAVPYLQAMFTLNSIDDMYMYDDARSIINYFLANANTWRGPVAKQIKEELKALLKGKPSPESYEDPWGGRKRLNGFSDDIPDAFFRPLSPAEQEQFRAWARANYRRGDPIDPAWHPIVRAECAAMNQEPVVLDQPEQIAAFRLLTLRSGLKLEILGMRRHGTSCYAIIKREFGLRGSKKSVLDQFTAMLRQMGVLRT